MKKDTGELKESSSRSNGRQVNVRRLLEALRAGPSSQASLARQMDLAPATVSNLVRGLRDQGLAEIRPVNGRESVVALVSTRGCIVSVQVRPSSITAALFDFTASIRHQIDVSCGDVGVEPGGSPDLVEHLVRQLVDQAHVQWVDVRGVAVAVAAPISRPAGTVGSWARVHLPAWRDVVLEDFLGDALGLPVIAENDANLAALAEWTWGAGRGATQFLYVLCSTGIGGGIVLDGRIYRGSDGMAGEVGHFILEPSGPVCFCGSRGCLTTFASERSILLALETSGAHYSSLSQVIDSARDGDAACRAVLWDAGRHLGRALAGTAKLLSPAVIAVGGSLNDAGPLLFDSLNSSVEMNSLRAGSSAAQVRQAEIGVEATLLGGVALILDRDGQGVSALPGWMRKPVVVENTASEGPATVGLVDPGVRAVGDRTTAAAE